ncbi:MAG TPA: hypothetical protein VGQ83_24325 [Polyangia bacterium]|jgi:hypothetical protein
MAHLGTALRALALVAALLAAGCGPPPGVTPAGDTPAPADAARAAVRLRVDLPAAQGCERTFDLALYHDRGIDLIQWDARRGQCAGRVVVIRYLSARLDRAAVVAAATRLAARVEVLAKEGTR